MADVPRELVDRYMVARAKAKRFDAEAEDLKAEIKSHMGASQYLAVGPYKITWKHVFTPRLSQEKLKAAYPTIHADCLIETESRPFIVKGNQA